MDPQRKRMKPDSDDNRFLKGNNFLNRRILSTPPPSSPNSSPHSSPPPPPRAPDESPKRSVRARRARWMKPSNSNKSSDATGTSSRKNCLGESSGETLSTSSLASVEPLENNYFNVDRNKNVITFDDSFHDLVMTDDEDGGSQSSSRSLHCTPPPVLKREKSLLKKKQCPPTPCPSSGSNQCRRVSLFGRTEQRSHNASIVSFKPEEDAPALSPLYSPSRQKEDYLNQTFVVRERIGSGSFGEVFRAISKDDSKHYAIKVMRSPFRNNARRAMVLEEVRKHELLPEHPNLVGFVSAWEEQDRLFIQTELCTKSLANMCNHDHYISEDRVWKYFIDILFAVHHLHMNNIIHVDIKPDNIFLTKDDTCKLGDFGLSFDLLHDDVRSLDEGDCRYLAPEVLNHRPTQQADIYSMGITVFELATDMDLPQRGRYWVYIRQGRVQRRFLDMIPESLKHVVYAMMNPQPSLRPTTVDLLMNERVRSNMTKTQELVFKEYHTGKKAVQQSSTFSGFWDYLKYINNFFKR